MTPDDLKSFRFYSEAERDREMEKYFREERERQAQERSVRMATYEATRPATLVDTSECDLAHLTGVLPPDLEELLDRLKSGSCPSTTTTEAPPEHFGHPDTSDEPPYSGNRCDDLSESGRTEREMTDAFYPPPSVASLAEDLIPIDSKTTVGTTTDAAALKPPVSLSDASAALEARIETTADIEGNEDAAAADARLDIEDLDEGRALGGHELTAGTKTPVRSSADDTGFPVRDIATLSNVDDDDGDREMSAINAELLAHQNYHLVRSRYCHLSIRMNLEGRQAPAFRTKLIAEPKHGDPVLMLMHRDRLVIDYHWCHASRMVLSINEPAHVALFGAPEFDFAAAWTLTGKKWKSRFRAAEVLCLTRHQQCQTMTLHDEELANQLKKMGTGWLESGGKTTSKRAKFNRSLGEWAERDKRIKSERRSFELLWLTREMLGHAASDQAIAKLHALAVGRAELNRSSIRDKLKRLDKNVPIV